MATKVQIDTRKALIQILPEAKKQLIAQGLSLERAIKQKLSQAGTGKIYVRGKKVHQASAPDEPPAIDTGRLRASISTNWSDSGMTEGVIGNQADLGDGVKQPSISGEEVFKVVVGTNVEYACLKANTNVLTKFGWKRISTIKEGEKVLTQTGEYHKVLKKIKVKNIDYPDMITLEIKYRQNFKRIISMTKEHKVLVFRNGRNKWIKAGELLVSDKVFCTPKTDSKKGISKYSKFNNFICMNCNKSVQSKSGQNNRKRKFCNAKCRNEYWKKTGTNPHIGMKRSKSAKEKMSKAMHKRLLENPKSHANYILGKKGHKINIEKEMEEWLKNRGVLKRRFHFQYPIDRFFVDFYIPSLNEIYEADGSYWHKNQQKDIERDKKIKIVLPGVKINHVHFYNERFSPKNIIENPLPNVYYSVCNPGVNSYVDLSTFKSFEILSIKKWKYKETPLSGKQKGIRPTYLHDLCIDKIHSYYANGVLVSNSTLEFGNKKILPRPFMRSVFDLFKIKRKLV